MKRISLLLAISMILSMLVIFPVNAEDKVTVSVWDGKYDTSIDNSYAFSGGTGEKNDPYIIANAKDLSVLSRNSNNGASYGGKWFKLTCDIVLNSDYEDYMDWVSKAPANTWNPIGKSSFSGNFDGNGHIIYGMYNKDTTNSTSKVACGFFGNMLGAVKNLGFVNCVAIHVASAEGQCAGIIANTLGTTSESGTPADITGCYVKDCYTEAYRGAGLFAGKVFLANIRNCYAIGKIGGGRSGESDIGGLIGWCPNAIKTAVSDCFVLSVFDLASGASVVGSVIGNVSKTNATMQKTYFSSVYSGQSKAIGWYTSDNINLIATDIDSLSSTVKTLKVADMNLDTSVWMDGKTYPELRVFDRTPAGLTDADAVDSIVVDGGFYTNNGLYSGATSGALSFVAVFDSAFLADNAEYIAEVGMYVYASANAGESSKWYSAKTADLAALTNADSTIEVVVSDIDVADFDFDAAAVPFVRMLNGTIVTGTGSLAATAKVADYSANMLTAD